MKANVIEPVGLADADDAFPRFDIGGRIAGQREDAAFERASQKKRPTVEHKLRACGLDVTDAEGDLRCRDAVELTEPTALAAGLVDATTGFHRPWLRHRLSEPA